LPLGPRLNPLPPKPQLPTLPTQLLQSWEPTFPPSSVKVKEEETQPYLSNLPMPLPKVLMAPCRFYLLAISRLLFNLDQKLLEVRSLKTLWLRPLPLSLELRLLGLLPR
jgi:hypothetical protein